MDSVEPANNNRTGVGRVLIVDDEPVLRRLMRRALAGLELEIVEAANGAEALERFASQDFSAVITDVRMPLMDGLELVSHLRQLDPELPIILVSGSDEVSSRAGARALGAFDFLPKPFDLFDLGCRVLSAIAARPPRVHRRQVA
jgi:two-component system KDP operon response regulator KdpE